MRSIAPFLALVIGLVACQDRQTTGPTDGPQLAVTSTRPVHQVIGGGSIVREDIAGAPREIYGFQALVDAAGRATGEAEVHFPSDVVKMHIAVKCLAIERNMAWLSGPVTRSDNPATPVGRVFLWQVQDNGEVQGAPPDFISNFVYKRDGNYQPDVCRWKPAMDTYPWDNGNVWILTPGAPSLSDLVGTWDATVLYFINPENPADTADLFKAGAQLRWTVAPDGRFSQIWWRPGVIFENVTGVMDLVNGQLVMWTGEDPTPTPIACQDLRFNGSTMSARCDVEAGYDWDGDGDDDPSRVVGEWRLKRTGVLVGDVAGTWDATKWRYTSVSDPTRSVNLVSAGVAITLTVGLDSRGTVAFSTGETDTGELLFDGSQMLTRNGEAAAYTFTLDKTTWSFTGLHPYDVDGNGTREPATLEVVLARR